MNLADVPTLSAKMLRPALAVVGFALLVIFVVRIYGVRFVLFPNWVLPKNPPRPFLDRGEVWILDTDEGTVEAFFLPAAQHAQTVIFTHGNGELIDDHLSLGSWYQEHGFSVLIPEYRGYGRSNGTPSKDALTRDFVVFYDRLRAHPAVDAGHIYFHGRSLGGAIAAAAAVQRAPRALVLESTFTSVRQLARDRGIPGFLVADSFDSETALRNASFPVLLIQGSRDDIVPARHARQLASVIPRHTVLMLDCGHNDCPLQKSDILRFLQTSGS
jgi:fermentation-respiration switch protein FrsA (DUF1100 family)